MFGIVLWYNPEKDVGMVWCEDQGPLAYVNAETSKPAQMAGLFKGALIRFDCTEKSGIRTVKAIYGLTMSSNAIDLAEVLAGNMANELSDKKPKLGIVA